MYAKMFRLKLQTRGSDEEGYEFLLGIMREPFMHIQISDIKELACFLY